MYYWPDLVKLIPSHPPSLSGLFLRETDITCPRCHISLFTTVCLTGRAGSWRFAAVVLMCVKVPAGLGALHLHSQCECQHREVSIFILYL